MSKLTRKQQRFVDEYLIDLNATQAAIRAGYSQKTAQQMGCENLTKPLIQEAISNALDKRSERTGIDADFVLNGIAKVIKRCEQGEKVTYQNGDPVMVETPNGELAPAWKFDASNALKGYELLGKHLQIFTDKAGDQDKEPTPVSITVQVVDATKSEA